MVNETIKNEVFAQLGIPLQILSSLEGTTVTYLKLEGMKSL